MSTSTSVDDLTDLETNWDKNPECDHTQHQTFKQGHAGPAAWATTTTCRGCGHVSNGLRCEQWRTYCLTVRGQVYCVACDRTQTTHDYYADTH